MRSAIACDKAYISFVGRHNREHPCASRLSPSALSPLPGWHGRKPCRRTKTRTNPSPAPAARLLPRRRVSCNRKAGPAQSTLSLAALLPQAHKMRPRRACRPRQKVRRRQSSSLTRNSKRSPNRANRDSGLKSEPSTAFTMCFSAGSRRRSARQGSELINTGGVLRSRQFAIPHPGSGYLVWASLHEASARHGYSRSADCVPITLATVSYTHLRAHETRHDLVCRLLLE